MELNLERLHQLATQAGVATEYWDYAGKHQLVSATTLQAILGQLDLPAQNNQQIAQSLSELEIRQWRQVLPSCVVARQDYDYLVKVHVPDGRQVLLELHFEQGDYLLLEQTDHYTPAREISGQLIGEATFRIPPGLPLGWHTLVAHVEGYLDTCKAPAAITPGRLEFPPLRNQRAWGIMTQFYAGLSAGSWGIGDCKDLAETTKWAGSKGADFALINPVHASQVASPLENSPYLPCSRQFWNPIYIRPEWIEEYGQLSRSERLQVGRLQAKAADSLGQASPSELGAEGIGAVFYHQDLLHRDQAWAAKKEALELIYQVKRGVDRQAAYLKFCQEIGSDLDRFSLWCALIEKHGFPLPAEYKTIDPNQDLSQYHLEQRIDFYRWCQWVIFSQLQRTQQIATSAGMRIGIMHDLAVGIHSQGADVWAHPEYFASEISVGAPADMYNQLGQNWSQPPWRPDRLEQSAYRPLRKVVAAAAALGGALRIDHIMGLLRLWWIPRGALPKDGTYVYYNRDAMVGVVLLEAWKQGIILIGEDLGTVEPGVREYLRSRGILGTGVLWFEFESPERLRPPAAYPEAQLAAVNTHDMPPAAGYLQGEDLHLRQQLQLLDVPYQQAKAQEQHLQAVVYQALKQYADLVQSEGSLPADTDQVADSNGQADNLPGADPAVSSVNSADETGEINPVAGSNSVEKRSREVIGALYRYIARSPSKLVTLTLADALGQRRTQNQPGTSYQYPNWRIPLSDGTGKTVFLETLFADQQASQLLQMLEDEVHSDK